ncbi:ankyrin repeat-containing domain protein, partial [Aspergillus pseudoustus]
MPLLALPNELLELIAEALPSARHVSALARANHELFGLLNPYLYRQDARSGGSSALLWAGDKGNVSTARFALRHRADVRSCNALKQSPLLLAATNRHLPVARLLLQYEDVDVNAHAMVFTKQKTQDYFIYDYQTPIICAARNGDADMVHLLLQHPDLDINDMHKCNNRNTALIWAALEGHARIVDLLLSHKDIEMNGKNLLGMSALSCAAREGHRAVVESLLSFPELDVNSKIHSDSLPQPELPRSLGYARTALQLAVAGGHNAIVKLLLSRTDIDTRVRDARGHTPAEVALKEGNMEAYTLLTEHGS